MASKSVKSKKNGASKVASVGKVVARKGGKKGNRKIRAKK